MSYELQRDLRNKLRENTVTSLVDLDDNALSICEWKVEERLCDSLAREIYARFKDHIVKQHIPSQGKTRYMLHLSILTQEELEKILYDIGRKQFQRMNMTPSPQQRRNETMAKKAYVKVMIEGSDAMIVEIGKLSDMLQAELDNCGIEQFKEFSIEIVTMSEAEYKKLPEHMGF